MKYKSKIEAQLKSNNLGSAWSGMKTITGVNEREKKKVELPNFNSDHQLALSLNDFYNRFDVHDFGDKHCEITHSKPK